MTIDDIFKLEKGAQRAAEARLMDCMEGVFDENYGESASAAFCGCNTCVVREVLDAAWPWMYRMAHHPDTLEP